MSFRSSSFTFGRTRASSVSRSLNHDLFAVDDVEAGGQLLTIHTYTLQVEDTLNAGVALDGDALNSLVNRLAGRNLSSDLFEPRWHPPDDAADAIPK